MFPNFKPSIAFQRKSSIDRRETQYRVLVIEQTLFEGKYGRIAKELEFLEQSGSIIRSENAKLPEFVEGIDKNLLITGILSDQNFALILIYSKDVNKFCKTSESVAEVRHLLIEFFFLCLLNFSNNFSNKVQNRGLIRRIHRLSRPHKE